MKIWVSAPSRNSAIVNKLKTAIRMAAKCRGKLSKALNLVLVGDAGIKRLNKSFLGRNKATDVIAFQGDGNLLGEIAISVDTARRQARERKVKFSDEMKLLAVHGFLHLIGFDDETLPEWKKMRTAEFEEMIRIL